MKKWIFYVSMPIFTTGIGASIIAPIIMQKVKKIQNNNLFDINRFNNNFEYKTEVSFKKMKMIMKKELTQHLNSADINLFYNSSGAITSNYILKLALLALADKFESDNKTLSTIQNNREIHFAYSPEEWENQKKINVVEFDRLLKSKNSSSSIINTHFDSTGQILNYWKKIIQDNPDKKINIWWNHNHVDHLNGTENNTLMELAGFGNVNIELLEDGAVSGLEANAVLNDASAWEKVNTIDKWNEHSNESFAKQFVHRIFENTYSWFSTEMMNNRYGQGLDKRLMFLNTKNLNDSMFNLKIKDGEVINRISKYWPTVSGLNWRNVLKQVQDISAINPAKKNFIIIGNYGPSASLETELIKHVWEKYHDQYNIFYKGHPGHNETTLWINNEYAPSHEGIYTIESAIPSEELTRDHIDEGMKFDAVASSIGTSSAMKGFPSSTYDLRKQMLSVVWHDPAINADRIVDNDPSDPVFNSYIQWLIDNKYIA